MPLWAKRRVLKQVNVRFFSRVIQLQNSLTEPFRVRHVVSIVLRERLESSCNLNIQLQKFLLILSEKWQRILADCLLD